VERIMKNVIRNENVLMEREHLRSLEKVRSIELVVETPTSFWISEA
jgi:hypothetical protein